MRSMVAVLICVTLWSSSVFAQARTIFAGVPSVKISEGGVNRVVEKLERPAAANVAVVISEINGRYYWASRENKELSVFEGGAFITFTAVDGSGYIRVLDPGMKSAAALIYDSVKAFDYVEHLLIGLKASPITALSGEASGTCSGNGGVQCWKCPGPPC